MLVLPNNNGGSGQCDVTKAYVDEELKKKVNIIPGKGLSTNDFTNEHKKSLEQLNVVFETVEG